MLNFQLKSVHALIYIICTSLRMTENKKREARVFYYRNLVRQDSFERDSSDPHGTNRFTLKGIASIDISLLDVYYLYFPSIFKRSQRDLVDDYKEYQRSQNELSLFFIYYLKFLMYQSLYSQNNKRTYHIRQLLDDIVPKLEYNSLRGRIDNILQGTYDEAKITQMNKSEPIAFEEAKKLKGLIASNRKRLITQLTESQENLWKEYFPEKMIDLQNSTSTLKSAKSYLQRVCSRIENILVVLKSRKKELLKRMCSDLKNNIEITIPYLTKKEKERKGNQGDSKHNLFASDEKNKKEVRKQNDDNQIIMAKITNAVEPILTDMMDYLTFRSLMEKKETSEGKKNSGANNLQNPLVVDFIKNASRYYKNSKVTYPYLSIKDTLFDQKGLKVHFKHTSLIYEGLALHKNTNSIELDLSTCPTPSAFDFQACYKETEQNYIWELEKKYLYPQIYVTTSQLHRDSKEKQEAKIKEQTHQQIYESIYIWRICCIIYFMTNRKNLMRESYHEYYSKIYQNPTPPFYKKWYEKHLRQVYHEMQKRLSYFRAIMFSNKLTLQNENQNQLEQEGGFDFTMKGLQSIYGLDSSEDSMIARYNSNLVTSQFASRILISKDIMSMMNNEKIFRRLINAKKYIIMFSISAIQHLYQVITLIYHECRKRGSRRKMLNSLRDYRDVYFSSEEEKRTSYIKSTLNKLEEYSKREFKDPQNKFLKENQSTTKRVANIGKTLKEIIVMDKKLNTLEHSMANQQNDKTDFAYRKIAMQILEQGEKSLVEAYRLLSEFVKEHIENKQASELNKLEFSKNVIDSQKDQKQIEIILKSRLLQSIKAFLKMRRKNIYLYNSSIIPRLMGSSKDAFKDLQKFKKSYLQQIPHNLEMIDKILASEAIVNNIEDIHPTWWREEYKEKIKKRIKQEEEHQQTKLKQAQKPALLKKQQAMNSVPTKEGNIASII